VPFWGERTNPIVCFTYIHKKDLAEVWDISLFYLRLAVRSLVPLTTKQRKTVSLAVPGRIPFPFCFTELLKTFFSRYKRGIFYRRAGLKFAVLDSDTI